MAEKIARRRFLEVGAGAALSLGLAGCRESGPFPSGPIRMVVPYGAGGGTDLEARAIAPYLQRYLGVSITVENQAGADGRLALSRFARQPPDGYTIAVYGVPSMILGEVLGDASYQVRDFTHLFAWIRESQVLVTAPDRWPDFAAFLAEARRVPLTAGVPYLTSSSRLAGLAMTRATGAEFTWVPFGSANGALAALLGGHVDLCIPALGSCHSLVEAGSLEALLVFSDERDEAYPEAPTPAEFDLALPALPIVRGAVAPAGLDPTVHARLEQAFADAAADPEFLEEAARTRTPVHPLPAEAYLEQVERYYAAIAEYDPAALTGGA